MNAHPSRQTSRKNLPPLAWLALGILALCLGGCSTLDRADDSLNHTIDRLQDKSYNGPASSTAEEAPLVQGR